MYHSQLENATNTSFPFFSRSKGHKMMASLLLANTRAHAVTNYIHSPTNNYTCLWRQGALHSDCAPKIRRQVLLGISPDHVRCSLRPRTPLEWHLWILTMTVSVSWTTCWLWRFCGKFNGGHDVCNRCYSCHIGLSFDKIFDNSLLCLRLQLSWDELQWSAPWTLHKQ